MPDREDDPLCAVCDALEELADAQHMPLAELPMLTRLRTVAETTKGRRAIARKTWLQLAAVFHEAGDEAERMAT